MLDKLAEKVLKNKEKKSKNINKEFKTLSIILLVCVAVVVYLGVSAGQSINDNLEESKNVSLGERLDQINNNYFITVTKTQNDKETSIEIRCDEEVCFYVSDSINPKEKFIYNSKWYSLSDLDDVDNATIVESSGKDVNEKFNPIYYNLDLIKSLVLVSNRTIEESGTINASVTLERYLKEYNYLYSKIYKTTEEIDIPITIKYSASMISSIAIELKDVDAYFNKTSYDTLLYKIDIESVDATDYDSVRVYFNNK